MKISEIMHSRSLQYCNPDTKLREAAQLMKKGNCGALPVVDKEKQVIGIITDRDICLSMSKKHGKEDAKRTVGQVMGAPVFTIKTNDTFGKALQQMKTHRVGRLPVVDENGQLKGIVSLHHFLKHAANGNTKHTQKNPFSFEKIMNVYYPATGEDRALPPKVKRKVTKDSNKKTKK